MTEDARVAHDRRVSALFERAFGAPEDAQERLLAEERDDAVVAEVRELLRTERTLGEFLEVPAAHRLFGTADDDVVLAPGARVGDFEVRAVLGVGGAGTVYDAEQLEPRRRVALKVLRPRTRAGRDARELSADALRTWRDEARRLAQLRHEGIAHVYAAGVLEHERGARAWIAMERVHGARSVVSAAVELALGRDARLALFLRVCDALQHAHQRGVIHRDVTPGNVLVDADGAVKVVDFGIAGDTADAADRGAGEIAGTPAYASPEQLAGDGAVFDVRTDVYGLGVLLYELLSGVLPHDVDHLPISEAVRAKREVSPVPPSRRCDGVPPDLDAIVLRALRAERSQRYESVEALALDVRRFLAHEPVAAYGGGTRYQLAKLVRRRRGTALAVASVAAALVAGAAVSLWLAVESTAARRHAERRSYLAEIAAAAGALRSNDRAEAARRLARAPAELRDWEWHHLAARLDGSRETWTLERREIWSGSASADGALVAVAGPDRASAGAQVCFVVLARRDGTLLREWRFRADDRDRTVRWERGDGTVLGAWRSREIAGLPVVALTRAGDRLAVGTNAGGVFTYDVTTDVESAVTEAHTGRVIDVEFTPDGRRFVTAGHDGGVRMWSAVDHALVRDFGRQPDRVISVAFDETGSRLATGCRDGTIRVFDAEDGVLLRRFDGHEASVEGVAFGSAGTRLASVSRDQSVRLWDVAGGAALAVGRSHTSNVRDVAFDTQSGVFVSASWDGTLRLWDAATGAERGLLRGHASGVSAVALVASEPRLVSFARDGCVKRWDPQRPDVATCRELRDQAAALAFDPSGRSIVVAGRDGLLARLDASSARVTDTVSTGTSPVRDLVFHDADTLVLMTAGDELQVWRAAADAPPVRLRAVATEGTVLSSRLALDPSTGCVWVGGRVGPGDLDTLFRFDPRTGELAASRSVPVRPDVVACDGRGGIAVGARDGRIAYAAAGAAWITTPRTGSPVLAVAFDEAGERLLVAGCGGAASILRVSDLSPIVALDGHSDDVSDAAFLPGGRRVVTVSRDLTVRLWDTADGENVLVLHEHGYPVARVAVDRDGGRIATGAGAIEDAESTIKIWVAPGLLRNP